MTLQDRHPVLRLISLIRQGVFEGDPHIAKLLRIKVRVWLSSARRKIPSSIAPCRASRCPRGHFR